MRGEVAQAMFMRWGPVVVRLRWLVLTAAGALLVVGAAWGTGVFGVLSGGGFTDPDSEAVIAHDRIAEEVGSQDTHLVLLYSSDSATVDDPAFAESVTAAVDELRDSPFTETVVSWYDTGAPGMVSADRQATYVTVQFTGVDTEDQLLERYDEVEPLVEAAGVSTQIGGLVAFYDQSIEQSERDIVRAEVLSFPVLLILLVLLFRGLVAAVTPLLIGGLAILGAFVTTRMLASVSDVSIFAINFITVIGLGLAIDYSLLVVNRFREEVRAGREPETAVVRTLATAGRSVLVSALTTIAALATLLIFPQAYLRSMATGGIAAIGIAMLGSLTVLPALLAVLGHRIDAGKVRLPGRRRRMRAAATTGESRAAGPAEAGSNEAGASAGSAAPLSVSEGGWARVARSVMRRPIPYLVAATAVVLLLASPALTVQFGGFDERDLPAHASARVVAERIGDEFPDAATDPIVVLVSGATPAQAEQYAATLRTLPEVTGAEITAQRGESTVVAVGYPGEPTGEPAWDAVTAIRDQPPPAGAEVLVGGRTASDVDMVGSLQSRLPLMFALMAGAIMLVLFLAFGSVLLPIKAVLMNLLSIGAALGVVVWGFQDGNLAGLLNFTATGFVDPTVLLLMFAVLFGISTDYEVFLLSRVREEWDRTGDNAGSIAYGLQRTGRIITAVALLLIVVIGGFAAGEMAFVKLLGIGMIVAIALDATLIRMLLVPATMRLLGKWNWWVPGPLGRLYRRYRIHDVDPPEPAPNTV